MSLTVVEEHMREILTELEPLKKELNRKYQ